MTTGSRTCQPASNGDVHEGGAFGGAATGDSEKVRALSGREPAHGLCDVEDDGYTRPFELIP